MPREHGLAMALTAGLVRMEIGFDLDDEHVACALRSPAYLELMRQLRRLEGEGRDLDDDAVDLTRIWEAAGSPPDRPPATFPARFYGPRGPRPGEDPLRVEDRGPGGVRGGYELAAWYVTDVDPAIGPDDVCRWLY